MEEDAWKAEATLIVDEEVPKEKKNASGRSQEQSDFQLIVSIIISQSYCVSSWADCLRSESLTMPSALSLTLPK